MTSFKEFRPGGVSLMHTTTFFSQKQEYELTLIKISRVNLYESTVVFPSDYIFSGNGCWEISFDLAENIREGHSFEPPPQGTVNALEVMRTIERAISDHYNEFKSGMYIFQPDSIRLEKCYMRLISRRLGQGFTLEFGLDPDRRGYVLRTPKCY